MCGRTYDLHQGYLTVLLLDVSLVDAHGISPKPLLLFRSEEMALIPLSVNIPQSVCEVDGYGQRFFLDVDGFGDARVAPHVRQRSENRRILDRNDLELAGNMWSGGQDPDESYRLTRFTEWLVHVNVVCVHIAGEDSIHLNEKSFEHEKEMQMSCSERLKWG
jgi:hypothetical protein